MSGILRSTVRFVGTAKYATNTSTKCFQIQTRAYSTDRSKEAFAMDGPTHVNYQGWKISDNSQGNNILLNIWMSMKKKIFSKFSNNTQDEVENNTVLSSDFGNFVAGLGSGATAIITKQNHINLIFPAVFKTKCNGFVIQPKRNTTNVAEENETLSYHLDHLSVSLDSDKLKLKIKDRAETFIVNHAVHVEAAKKPDDSLEVNCIKNIPRIIIDDITTGSATLTIQDKQGKKSTRLYKPKMHIPAPNDFDLFGVIRMQADDELKTADDPGRIILQFPMKVSLEGYHQIIKIKETNETFIIYQTVEIEALEDVDEDSKVTILNEKPKAEKFEIQLVSGQLVLGTRDPADDKLLIKHEILMGFELDGEKPLMYLCPSIKCKNRLNRYPPNYNIDIKAFI